MKKTILVMAILSMAFGGKLHAQNETIFSIMTRTSVRSYTDKAVEEDKVKTLMMAAMAAPSAGNRQPWAFVVVNQDGLLKRLAGVHEYAKMIAVAPMAIVVCGDMKKAMGGEEQGYWVQDCSAAAQNILLAAHSMGLGAVWTGVYPTSKRVAKVQELLNLEKHLVPLAVIAIGYPEGRVDITNKYNEENIYYNRFLKK